jgi:hypothetical protein
LVITVLHSADDVVAEVALAAVAGFASVPAAALGAAGLGFAEQIPSIVITAASDGTDADASGGSGA